MSRIEEAVIDYWGERCDDFDANCPTCQAWAEMDAVRAGQWQEISTAPRDGSSIMLWIADDRVIGPHCFAPVSICDRTWWDDATGDQIEPIERATHWAPLPPPPSTSQENA